MPSYKEDGKFEVESIVHIVVIDDDCRTEDNPDRNDHSSGDLHPATLCWRRYRLGEGIICTRRNFFRLVENLFFGVCTEDDLCAVFLVMVAHSSELFRKKEKKKAITEKEVVWGLRGGSVSKRETRGSCK